MKGEKAAKPMTLEEYAGFFHNPHLRHLVSHEQLNQVPSSLFLSSPVPSCLNSFSFWIYPIPAYCFSPNDFALMWSFVL